MESRDPGVDAYIDRAAEFAQPILRHLRGVVHATCPEVEEAIKWGFPNFMYRGMLCSMAAFKQHCAFGFWRATLITGSGGPAAEQAMGQFGRITSLADLPPDEVLAGYLREAMRLNEAGVKTPRKPSAGAAREIPVPEDFAAALEASPAASAAFQGFSPSQRREYLEWIGEAKSEATRMRRLDTAMEWIAEGKPRHWKYAKPKSGA